MAKTVNCFLSGEVFKEVPSCTLMKIFPLVFDDSEDEGLGAGGEESEAPGDNYHHPCPGPLFDRVDGGERSGDADEPKPKRVRQLCAVSEPASLASPVNTEDHQEVGGQDEAASPHHHQHFAQSIPSVPLRKIFSNCYQKFLMASAFV